MTKAEYQNLLALHTRKGQEEQRAFLVEGIKGVSEVVRANWQVRLLVVSREFLAKQRDPVDSWALSHEKIRLAKDESQMASLSATVTPPGVMAVVEMPENQELPQDSLVVALDGVADPGNLGTIIRTADWFGAGHLLLGPSSVSPYNPKVVRSAMGSLFHLPIRQTEDLVAELTSLKAKGYTVLAADAHGGEAKLPSSDKLCLVLGSESHGISSPVIAQADSVYTIPGTGQAESLNVAASCAILLFALHQQSLTAQHHA